MSRKTRGRVVRPTLLIVGEGAAEIALIRHVRSLYCCDARGVALSHANANGKGAGNVIATAIAKRRLGAYTRVAAMFDVDTGWDDRTRKSALRASIVLVPSSPCLEASLLEIVGLLNEGGTQEQKQRFKAHFGDEAHADQLIATSFPKEVLDAARARVAFLTALLGLIDP